MLPRRVLFELAALLALCLCAGVNAQAQQSADTFQWHSGLSEISDGWMAHDGDNPAWAAPAFDDSGWKQVDLEDMGAARPGWHWYRRQLHLGADYDHVHLLLQGGDGAYELYVNGQRMNGASLKPALEVKRPIEQVFSLESPTGDYAVAIRSRIPPSYYDYHLPLFLSVTLGGPTSIDYEQAALRSERLYDFLPSLAINMLVALAGLGALALFALQRNQRDYLFLSLYLLAISTNAVWVGQQDGILPISANLLLADPLFYVTGILLIEFTFSFVRRRVTWPWRLYEAILLSPILLVPFCWFARFSGDAYLLIQAAVTAPMAVLPPAVLYLWYRRGNREAAWLIFPALLPSATGALFDIGAAAYQFNWPRLQVLEDPFNIGPVSIRPSDVGSFLFLIAIGLVVFFRFIRASREQAQSAAELGAAREIQQRLVPLVLPQVQGYTVRAAYRPAQEVGGDFYQVLPRPDGATLLVLGDVSGKGLKAAMTGTLAIGALRSLATENLSPAQVLERLNRSTLETQDGGFITCVCARISDAGELTVANAGHLSPYLNGHEIQLESGLPLGITGGVQFPEATLRLAPDDCLTLLSDGVVEAQNASGELFGFERTAALSRSDAETIAEAAQAFGQSDDITVLTLTHRPAVVLSN